MSKCRLKSYDDLSITSRLFGKMHSKYTVPRVVITSPPVRVLGPFYELQANPFLPIHTYTNTRGE